jgi:hypothetical protein
MTPVLVSVDKAGDLKIGRKKCRLYRKGEVAKVARKYGINTDKKTVSELCGAIKSRAKNSPMNNTPLAKLYPEAAKKRAEKKALNKKIAANFMKGMVTTNSNIKKLRELNVKPKPSKMAKPITQKEAIKRIGAMKGLTRDTKFKLKIRVEEGVMSPRRVVKVARELSKLNANLR